MDLVEFLNARLDEDEADAKAAAAESPAPWIDDFGELRAASGDLIVDGVGYGGVSFRMSAIEHIARHDPARVLREVEAKRAIIDMETGTDSNSEWSGFADAHYRAMEYLAAVYSDHPDYRPEWKP